MPRRAAILRFGFFVERHWFTKLPAVSFAKRKRIISSKQSRGPRRQSNQNLSIVSVVNERVEPEFDNRAGRALSNQRINPSRWETVSDSYTVAGNEPPPCAKTIRKFTHRSSTPEKNQRTNRPRGFGGIRPSHGSQYFCISRSPIISWCTKPPFRSVSQALKKSKNWWFAQLIYWTFVPIFRRWLNRCLHRSNLTVSFVSCIGTVLKPTRIASEIRWRFKWSFKI